MTLWETAEDWIPKGDVDRGATSVDYSDDSVSLISKDSAAFAVTSSATYFIDVEAQTATQIATNIGYWQVTTNPDRLVWTDGSEVNVMTEDGTILKSYEGDSGAAAKWSESFVTLDPSSGNDLIYRLNEKHDLKLWESDNSNRSWIWGFALATDTDSVYMADNNGVISSFNASTGAFQWEQSTPEQVYALDTDGTYLYAGCGDSALRQLNTSNGSVNWTNTYGGYEQSGVATDGTGVYTGYFGDSSNQGYTGKLDESGGTVWSISTSDVSIGVGVGPDYVLISDGSDIRVLDKGDGTQLGSVTVGSRVNNIACYPGMIGAYSEQWWS